ncbi:Na+ antiporter [Mycolicibacterium chubuense NBB4]|uniref:Na+ antiporter n=1 Tax=Mycolicibacterium chubuense (strain NBB4) TaxID=710421 RepID=I4BKF6_MYCCN|nr:Na+/H+ antiporter [Mycolicibacterium chubuense]AFM17763.1 Na+ antiporter [Mycolicibacterium chubuense NBB4]
MAELTLLLLLCAATAVLAPLAERVNLPYPAVLLLFGMLLAPIPGLPIPSVNPNLILPLILPPLLFAAARRTSWRQFLDNRRAIGLLAVALVAVTAFAVGAVLHAVVPGLPLVAAVAIGAAVAPPDPVAATSVARRLNLPRRLRTILEGEGLSNDATALVLYEVAVASAMTGAFSPWHAGATLGVAVVVGVAAGLVVALAARRLIDKLPAHPAGSAIVLVTPFAAYAAADAVHGSGVLAVVTLALSLSRYSDAESAQTRLVSVTAWEIVELLVTGAAFAFVGLELRDIVGDVHGPLGVLIGQALLVSVVVIVIRFLWIFPVASLDERLHRRKAAVAEPIGWREMAVSSWAGMRGVVTLVTALALPAGFPERERLVFIAFVVVMVTLLVQGLTLPAVVKLLRVRAADNDQEQDLIRRARDAGMRRLDELRADGDPEVIDHVVDGARRMWHAIGLRDDDVAADEDRVNQERTAAGVQNAMLAAAREAVLAARSQSGTDPTVVDEVLRRLDARSASFD